MHICMYMVNKKVVGWWVGWNFIYLWGKKRLGGLGIRDGVLFWVDGVVYIYI